MADFVAVLRKTVGALADNTPEMREKVYDKARATIEAKLAAINPPPPPVVAERQRKALEDAIAVMRAEFDAKVEEEEDDALEDVFASLGKSEPRPAPLPPVAAAAGLKPLPPLATPQQPKDGEAVASAPVSKAADPATDPLLAKPDVDAGRKPAAAKPARPAAARRPAGGGRAGLIAALFALVVIAGAGYAVWLNKDDFAGLFGGSQEVAGQGETPAQTAEDLPEPSEEAEPAPAEEPVEQTARTEAPATEEPAGEPAAEQPAAEAPEVQPDPEPQKFTQRLMADGSEVDEGPAGGEPTVGEGTSIAAAAAAPQQTAPAAGETAAGNDETTPAVAVGQRAIFYEEGTSSAQGSADTGTIVWSLVQESPGGDLPPEPAIRAEATIPDKDVQLRMTIRRNGDQTLPASHIIEMIFLTPEGFEGGGIDNVQRIALKESEQAAGNPLIGIPAKIADGFFLIALNDSPAEVEANMTLLRRQSWIDIPLVYESGRRALVTLEKGIPGDRVFQEALQAWEQATSG